LLAEENSGYPLIEVAQSSITGFEAPPPGLHGWAGTGARF
jgi:hypothetical protein